MQPGGVEGIIIMEIGKQKSVVTKSNRLSNEPGVIRGWSNGSPSSTLVMGCSWGQDEHPTKKVVHEKGDEICDNAKVMNNVSKLGSAKEDGLQYIDKGLDRMDEVMERDEAVGDTNDAKE